MRLEMFEASLFNISVAETEAMDPQQRLLLESVVRSRRGQADGVGRSIHRGMHTGVMVGAAGSHFHSFFQSEDFVAFFAAGEQRSVLCGRVSYTFNLQGPSVTVDTACSASLVAAHQSFQAIKDGACDVPSSHAGCQCRSGILVSNRICSTYGKQRRAMQDPRCVC